MIKLFLKAIIFLSFKYSKSIIGLKFVLNFSFWGENKIEFLTLGWTGVTNLLISCWFSFGLVYEIIINSAVRAPYDFLNKFSWIFLRNLKFLSWLYWFKLQCDFWCSFRSNFYFENKKTYLFWGYLKTLYACFYSYPEMNLSTLFQNSNNQNKWMGRQFPINF